MIDTELIQVSSLQAQQSFAKAESTIFDQVFIVKDVLTDSAVTKLKEYIVTIDHSKWHKVPGQEHNNRKSITWDADTIMEELHEVFNSLTEIVNQKFAKQPVNFLGLQLWVDGHGYNTGYHSDDPIIDVSCQLYLFDNEAHYGTTFKKNKDSVVVSYYSKSGYIMINNVDPELLHSTTTPTPQEVTRYSLYAVWSRMPKQ